MDDIKKGESMSIIRQYEEQKSLHKDAVLFFRLGDFYEMFQADAQEISRILNLTLTQRRGVPMCGIPYHAAGKYIARLIKYGKKVAICEQVESPQKGKGLVKREVVEVITPGTVIEDAYLDEKSNNYLATLAGKENAPAFAYIDLSTGEFRATVFDADSSKDALRRELAKTAPKEMLIQESLLESNSYAFLLDEPIVLNRMPDWSFDVQNSQERLKRQLGTINLKAFGLYEDDPRIVAAGAILEYLEDNHKSTLLHVKSLSCYGEDDSVGLDASTIRNLELIQNLQDGGAHHTLYKTLDHTKTSAGARLLKRRLLQPFPKVDAIRKFHNRVEALYHNQIVLSKLRSILGQIYDIERLAARIGMDRAHAKDLVTLRHALENVIQLRDVVEVHLWDIDEAELEILLAGGESIARLLASSLLDEPSIVLTEGGMIRQNWDMDIDRMRSVRDEGKSHLDKYIREERAATGISSLKLKHNRILGYFIEIPVSQAKNIPERYRRRQSLTNAERYSTTRLDEFQSDIANIAERLIERERELFLKIRETVKKDIDKLVRIAHQIADIDLVQSFAHAATEYGYIRPDIREDMTTEIEGGRHPVVENHLPQGTFVPNGIKISSDGVSFALVTGPNMAGKSTVLRQIALITLMAQIGSFVPAESAAIGIVDRIFCRVGAMDNLARGESTFLVEMNETAYILRNATSRSLVIMDEVGRGTGTADGLAIARSVCEYLLANQSPRTLFATHFRELTTMVHDNLINLSLAVEKSNGKIVFTKKLVLGAAENSYGIHVAALAGLPECVIERAQSLLGDGDVQSLNVNQAEVIDSPSKQALLFSPESLVLDDLERLDIDSLSPLDALKLLYQWKNALKET